MSKKSYDKAPYHYSELFTRWRKAVGTSEAAALSERHSRLHLGNEQYDEVQAAIRRHRRYRQEDE
jgi:hypothetical protein